MSVTVSYNEEKKLILQGLECSCGCVHHPLTQDIYIGAGILERLPGWIEKRNLGKNCVLIADTITYGVAGERVEKLLTAAGFDVTPCVIEREGHVLPDDSACGEALLTITEETQFLVAVGSGSMTDITRINSMRTGLPFVSVGTAPSMDGYASVVSPLVHRGIKIQRKAVCPQIIACDTEVLATAPLKMAASGVGDVLGKYIALAEWKMSEAITGEIYCPMCGEIVMNAVNGVMNHIDDIEKRTPEGMQSLTEALVLAGASGIIVGSTRPVASVEHAVAQYWEMMMLQRGMEPPMHGASVGVATKLLWPLFERFAREDLTKLDPDEIIKNHMPDEKRKKWMLFAFGKEGGEQMMRANPEDFITVEEQKRRICNAIANQEKLRDILAEMPPLGKVENAMKKMHAELLPEEENIPQDVLDMSLWCGKDYRSRYTLLKTLDECGLLEKYLTETPYSIKKLQW